MSIGIIIQARTGSSRLPGKIILPFFENNSILTLLIEKLNRNFSNPVIISTTKKPNDDVIIEQAKKLKIKFYRGDTNNVLKRFIDTATHFNLKTVVRICSDNPFLSIKYLKELIEVWNDDFDYLSFRLSDGTPSILTHYGFWAEVVSLEALKKADVNLPANNKHREHVTSYIYSHPNMFSLKFLDIPTSIQIRDKIRLTLDTLADFKLQKYIYAYLVNKNPNFDVEEIIDFLEKNPSYYELMNMEILKNTK